MTDSREVRFYTNATVYQPIPQTSGPSGTLGGNSSVARSRSSRCPECPGFFNVACQVSKGCWGKFGSLLGMAGGSVVGCECGWGGGRLGGCRVGEVRGLRAIEGPRGIALAPGVPWLGLGWLSITNT